MIMQQRLVLTCTAALASTCLAQDPAPTTAAPTATASVRTDDAPGTASTTAPGDASSAANAWRAEFIGWIWVVGMDGTVGARGRQSDVNASFGDMLEASDSIFAFSGRLEVGTGAWTGFVDGMYSNLGVDNQSGPGGVADIDVTFQSALVDFGLMYRLGEWKPDGEAAKNDHNITLDLYAGARFTNLDLELSPAVLPKVSQTVSWFDPIVGAKAVLPISESWSAAINGDIGGFGAASDFTWSVTGVLRYDFNIGSTRASAFAGYRAIGQDYSDGSGNRAFTWDVVQHGPIIGLSFRF